MDDDVFGDLVSKKTVLSPGGSKGGPAAPAAPVVTKDESVGTSAVLCMGKEELEQLLAKVVTSAVDNTFGKFAKSLRTVLDDMAKRIESNNAAQAQMSSELRCGLQELDEAAEQQLENSACRFSTLEAGLREVERGVQAMRDKAELHEAQAMLAKYDPTPIAGTDKEQQSGLPPPAAEPQPQPTPAPTAATAPVTDAAPPAVQQQALPPPPMQQAVQQLALAGPPTPGMQAAHVPVASAPTMQPLPPHLSAPPPAMLGQQPSQPSAYAPQPGQDYYPYHVPASAPAAGLQAAPAPDPYQQQQQQPLLMSLTQQPFQQQHMPQQQQQQPLLLPQTQPFQQQHVPQQQHPQQQQQQQPLLMQPFQQQPEPLQQHMPQQAQAQSLPTLPYSHAPQSMARVSAPLYMPGPSPLQAPPHSPSMSMSSSMYPVPRMPSYPAAPMQLQSAYSAGMQAAGAPAVSSPSAAPPQSKTTSRAVPLEQIITDITNMGFERAKVLSLVTHLQKSGQAMDLNVIIDKLTRG